MDRTIIKSLNIGLPKKEEFHGKEIFTGICKTPVTEPLHLGKRGLEGDGVGDPRHHGGYDKAVCVYNVDHYQYWENLFGITLSFAAFGENLSVSNIHEDDVCVGDVFMLGTAIVQVSQPRQPCKTLASRYGRADMIKLVVDAGFTGFYLRVLQEGIVEKKSSFVLVNREPHRISLTFANHILHHDRTNRQGIRKVLEVTALSESWRKSFLELRDKCK